VANLDFLESEFDSFIKIEGSDGVYGAQALSGETGALQERKPLFLKHAESDLLFLCWVALGGPAVRQVPMASADRAEPSGPIRNCLLDK
jgi:hypothetical protein